jgi:hypothetical protein
MMEYLQNLLTVFYAHLGWPNFMSLRNTCVSFECWNFLACSFEQHYIWELITIWGKSSEQWAMSSEISSKSCYRKILTIWAVTKSHSAIHTWPNHCRHHHRRSYQIG